MPDPLYLHRMLSADLSPEDVAALRLEVRAHFHQLVALQAQSELVATDLAELLCTHLEELLDAAPSMSSEHRTTVVGAARYFISSHDAVPDDRACVGLDDDVAVFNHAVEQIGRSELEIEA